jgi:hypothetical protein
LTPELKIRAECGNTACSDLCGGPEATPVPTATGEFTTADVYAFTRELEKLHPDNRHVKDKIRQQLQNLRDRSLLLHIDRYRWRLP